MLSTSLTKKPGAHRSHADRADALRRGLITMALGAFALVAMAFPAGASAQGTSSGTFYGYLADDMSTAIMVGAVGFDQPGMAALFVSPELTGLFFDNFGMFTNQRIASDLRPTEVAAVAGADEYLVYEGSLDFVNGRQPGYVIFLSVDEQVFLIVGYAADRGDLFRIAEQTIEAGRAPRAIDGYIRMELDQ